MKVQHNFLGRRRKKQKEKCRAQELCPLSVVTGCRDMLMYARHVLVTCVLPLLWCHIFLNLDLSIYNPHVTP